MQDLTTLRCDVNELEVHEDAPWLQVLTEMRLGTNGFLPLPSSSTYIFVKRDEKLRYLGTAGYYHFFSTVNTGIRCYCYEAGGVESLVNYNHLKHVNPPNFVGDALERLK